MSVEYNPFELDPTPRLFNYGKNEFEQYQEEFGEILTYSDLVKNINPNMHWVVFSDQMDYSGD